MLNEKRIKKNNKSKVISSPPPLDVPRWKALGFQDQYHYLDYKRNNDLDSIINDIEDTYDNYNW